MSAAASDPPAAADPMAVLRDATRKPHARVERHPLLRCLMRGPAEPEDYAAVLGAFHAYHAAVESRMLAVLEQESLIPAGYPYERRCDLLARDLADLGAPAATSPTPSLPTMDPPGRCLGVFYVLEGASQGGRVLGPILERRFGVDHRHGGRYFNVYGDRRDAQWNACRALLRRAVEGGVSLPGLVDAAGETFQTLHRHLETWHRVAAEGGP